MKNETERPPLVRVRGLYYPTDHTPEEIFQALGKLRKEAQQEVDRLLTFLDAFDGDPDLEPDDEPEDSDPDEDDDPGEDNGDKEPDVDSEPSLGATEPLEPLPGTKAEWLGRMVRMTKEDREGAYDQINWFNGGDRDTEVDEAEEVQS